MFDIANAFDWGCRDIRIQRIESHGADIVLMNNHNPVVLQRIYLSLVILSRQRTKILLAVNCIWAGSARWSEAESCIMDEVSRRNDTLGYMSMHEQARGTGTGPYKVAEIHNSLRECSGEERDSNGGSDCKSESK